MKSRLYFRQGFAVLVSLAAKSSGFKTRQFKILSAFQSSFFARANLQASQKPGYHPWIGLFVV